MAISITLLKKRDPWYTAPIILFPSLIYPILISLLLSTTTIVSILVFLLFFLIHLILLLLCFWRISFRIWFFYSITDSISSTTHVFVVPKNEHKGQPTITPLVQSCFFFQKRKYKYNSTTKSFSRVKLQLQKQPISFFIQQLSMSHKKDYYDQLREDYGLNQLDIPLPLFSELFREHALAPFFVFQVFCVLLWCLDEYWYYSLLTLFMLFLFESTVVQSRLRNLKQIQQMISRPVLVHVYRHSKWTQMLSNQLLPLDIIAIPSNGYCPCDIVLLQGKCIVDESLLTGESIPQIYDFDYTNVENDQEKKHVLHGGTKLLQSSSSSSNKLETPQQLALGMVIQTGFETAQGKLIRTILYSSTDRISANNKEAFAFIGILLCFALIASAYVLYHGLYDPSKSTWKLILNCILIITSCVPPELPMELSLAVNNSLLFLSKKGIFCTEPFRIPFAGKIRVCCFDKTGTLTSQDAMKLQVISNNNSMIELVGIACHSLIRLQNQQWIGDPMEKACIEYYHNSILDIQKQELDIVGYTLKPLGKFKIVKRYPFVSENKRMTVVLQQLQQLQQQQQQLIVVVKGAPEKVKQLCNPLSIPNNFDQLITEYTQSGKRVLACAVKKVSVAVKSREEMETDMEYCGLFMFQTEIKKDTMETIANLKQSHIQVIMITGDNMNTAIHVAKQIQMVPLESQIHIVNKEMEWNESYYYAMDGKMIEHVQSSANKLQLEKQLVLGRVVVFARVSPEQKEYIITLFKSHQIDVLMCGDGTNDVGALKQAHIGVALLDHTPTETTPQPPPQQQQQSVKRPTSFAQMMEQMQQQQQEQEASLVKLGDASIAAPFTSKKSTIDSCTQILKQGRCTLVTTMQMYKILALNCLLSAYSLSVLYLDGVKYDDTQMFLSGIIIALCFLFISRAKPLEQLSKEKPITTIFCSPIMTSIFGQFIIHLVSLIMTVWIVKIFDPPKHYLQLLNTVNEEEKTFEPNLLNTSVFIITSLQTVITFLVNYRGKPFMESLFQNRPLFIGLSFLFTMIWFICLGWLPQEFYSQFNLVSLNQYTMQNISFQTVFCCLLAIDCVSVYVLEKIILKLYTNV